MHCYHEHFNLESWIYTYTGQVFFSFTNMAVLSVKIADVTCPTCCCLHHSQHIKTVSAMYEHMTCVPFPVVCSTSERIYS